MIERKKLSKRVSHTKVEIRNTSPGGWADGFAESDNATPLQGVAAEETLDRLAHERLSLKKEYDVIVKIEHCKIDTMDK